MRKPITWAAGMLALSLLATSCGGAGEVADSEGADLDVSVGVTDDTVTIGTHQPLTGPASAGYLAISQGASAMFDYINDQGGIHGRKIEYLVKDDVYDPTKTVEVTQELVEGEQIFAMLGGLGTPTHSKVIQYLNDKGVPDLFPSSGALMWNDPEQYPLTYGYQVDYTKEAKVIAKYIEENFPDAKVAYYYQNDDVGSDSIAGSTSTWPTRSWPTKDTSPPHPTRSAGRSPRSRRPRRTSWSAPASRPSLRWASSTRSARATTRSG